jgi:YhcH/YjgK/YiaL family protein
MIIANYKELVIPEKNKSPNWEKALAWLKTDSWKDVPMGKTEIDGSNVFVKHSSYVGKSENEWKYERHRFYADIQMPIKGTELQLVCHRDGLKVDIPYSEENDIEFFEREPGIDSRFILSFPMVAVYFPWEVHMTTLSVDGSPIEIEKVLIKVLTQI